MGKRDKRLTKKRECNFLTSWSTHASGVEFSLAANARANLGIRTQLTVAVPTR